jgi:phosphate uptake regulator
MDDAEVSMKRKLVQQGSGALTMTVPAKWCKQHRLKAGDEIEVEEDEGRVILHPGPHSVENKKEYDLTISKSDRKFVRTLLGALYRRGFHVIRVHYEDESIYGLVKDATDNIIGFEIVDKQPGRCTVQSFLAQSDLDGLNAINKIINTTKTLQAICREDYINGKHDRSQEVESYYFNVWKLRDYVMRIVLDDVAVDNEKYNLSFIVWVLEKINTNYRYFYLNMKENRYHKDARLLHLFDEMTAFYEYFAETVHSRSFQRVEYIHTQYTALNKEGYSVFQKMKAQPELIVNLLMIARRIQDVSSFLVC